VPRGKKLYSVKKTARDCSCQEYIASAILLHRKKFKECAKIRRLRLQQIIIDEDVSINVILIPEFVKAFPKNQTHKFIAKKILHIMILQKILKKES
jgi:hypothetical protein